MRPNSFCAVTGPGFSKFSSDKRHASFLDLTGGRARRGEHPDDVAVVGVGVARLLCGQFGGEQQISRPGAAAGELPLVVGMQQAQPGDERGLARAVGVFRALRRPR